MRLRSRLYCTKRTKKFRGEYYRDKAFWDMMKMNGEVEIVDFEEFLLHRYFCIRKGFLLTDFSECKYFTLE